MGATLVGGANLKSPAEAGHSETVQRRRIVASGGSLNGSRLTVNAWREFGIALAVFAAAFLYLVLFRRYTAIEPDEGIILQGAQRVLHGQVLYRDFFSYFTPGSYYQLALLFKIFGSSMLVARTALAAYGGLLAVFTYLMARRVCAQWSALLAAYLVTITCLPWRFLVLHNWDSTLWACAAVYCAVRWLEALTEQKAEGRRQKAEGGKQNVEAWSAAVSFSSLVSRLSSPSLWALATGTFASLTTLFEQSKGVGLIMGLGLGFGLVVLRGQRRIRLSANEWLALGAGLAWPFLLTLAYFGAQHALPQMLADWSWPLHHYSRANAVPYGYQNWSDQARQAMFGHGLIRGLFSAALITPCFVLPVLPLIAVGLLAYLTTPYGRGKLFFERWRYYVLVCGAISGLLFSVVAARADILHFVYLGPFLYLVLAWLSGSGDFQFHLPHSLKLLIGYVLLLSFTFLGIAFLLGARGARFKLGTRRGRVETTKPDEVVQYTQAHVRAGSTILVYPYRPLYYYLTGAYNPTRFEYLQPGMHTREQDEEAIRDIEANRTRVVLFELGFNQKIAASWPNTPLQFIANDPVGDYILASYRSCKVLQSAADSRFLFMVRKDLSCPR